MNMIPVADIANLAAYFGLALAGAVLIANELFKRLG